MGKDFLCLTFFVKSQHRLSQLLRAALIEINGVRKRFISWIRYAVANCIGITNFVLMVSFSTVKILMYSPKRPLVDISEVFLWLMAVGTVLGASFWSAWTAKEAAQEHYRCIKVRFIRYFVPILLIPQTRSAVSR
jgi:hypothetical protein